MKLIYVIFIDLMIDFLRGRMKILINIIAYNEENNILSTINDLKKHGIKCDIAVIDNGSSDMTGEICKKNKIYCIKHCINTGGSMGTVLTYFMNGYRKDYDIICQFDGDGQHLASELTKIIQPIIDGKADYVIGSRFINRIGFQSTFIRRIGIKLFSFLISMMIGQKITDVTSGFRAYNRKVMELYAKRLRMELNDVNQLLLLSHFNGMRIIEVPVVMKERVAGKSEFDIRSSIVFPLKGLVNILGCYLQKHDYRTM
jgi:glycosyltransferase involved in cell wall biosynthesis